MSEPSGRRTAGSAVGGGWGVAAVVLAVGQPVSAAVFGVVAPNALRSGADVSPLVPPGAWFAIWTPVIVLSLAWSLVRFRARRRADVARAARGYTIAFAGFALWLTAAAFGSSAGWTLPPFVVLIAGLVLAARASVPADRARDGRAVRLLDAALLGIYGGWVTVAFWVNVATVTQAAGAPSTTTWGVVWQALVLAAGLGATVLGLLLTRGSLFYAATVVYALVGVAISTGRAELPPLVVAAAIGIAVEVATAVLIAVRGRRAPAAGSGPGWTADRGVTATS